MKNRVSSSRDISSIGMSVSYQFLERHPSPSITVLDKESVVGKNGSSRNFNRTILAFCSNIVWNK